MTPGTAVASEAAELLSSPDPVGVTMRSALIAWSALLVADRDSEAPKTDIAATRARPTMSAEAVWAVRRGLRIEFSRPSLPGSPRTRASGRPITLDSGRARAGASTAVPMKMATAPRPTSPMAGLASPMASKPTPIRASTAPRMNRRRSEAVGPDWRSSSAATGGMRTAPRAGPKAATTVTPTPTSSPTSTVRGSKTRGPGGSVIPNPRSSACSPSAASTPRPRPIAEETSPVRAASPSTDRNTWRRLAPTMRSRASSRVRCPTMIENVLKMVNPPTNSEMNAKTSSAVEKKDSA